MEKAVRRRRFFHVAFASAASESLHCAIRRSRLRRSFAMPVMVSQLVCRLFERDMAVEIVAPVAAIALQPLPFDHALEPGDHFPPFLRVGAKRVVEIDTTHKEECSVPPCFRALRFPRAQEGVDFRHQQVHLQILAVRRE